MKMSREDFNLIVKIIERAEILGVKRNRLGLMMDIEATNNTCPLKLQNFLQADDFNFLHDIVGIINNLNRETGELENYFLPRFAK